MDKPGLLTNASNFSVASFIYYLLFTNLDVDGLLLEKGAVASKRARTWSRPETCSVGTAEQEPLTADLFGRIRSQVSSRDLVIMRLSSGTKSAWELPITCGRTPLNIGRR